MESKLDTSRSESSPTAVSAIAGEETELHTANARIAAKRSTELFDIGDLRSFMDREINSAIVIMIPKISILAKGPDSAPGQAIDNSLKS